MPATRGTAGAAAAVSAPLVFSCRSCHRVVGDSFNFVWSSEEMNCITLNSAVYSSLFCTRGCVPTAYCRLYPPTTAVVNKKVVEVVKEDFITSKHKGPDAGRGASETLLFRSKATRAALALRGDGSPTTVGVGLSVVCVAHSTYYVMTCRGCSSMLGRSYQTTAKALDHIR